MEDILSSIKRIIAEDSDAALSPPRGKRSVAAAAAPRPEDDSDDDDERDVLELTNPIVTPPPLQEPVAEMPKPEAKTEAAPLVSPATVDVTRSSLAALSSLIVKPQVTGSDTLEGLVREMLKPMLTEWLDANLPDVVERLVAAEVRRIADRG